MYFEQDKTRIFFLSFDVESIAIDGFLVARARFLVFVGSQPKVMTIAREIQGVVLESIPGLRTGAVRIPSSNRHVRAEMQGP